MIYPIINSYFNLLRFNTPSNIPQFHLPIHQFKPLPKSMIRIPSNNLRKSVSFKLNYSFSTNTFTSADAQLSYSETNNLRMPFATDQQTQTQNFLIPKIPIYINYPKIYQQNKRLLTKIQENPERRHLLFDQSYLKTQIIDTKYFYADIVKIFSHVVQQLSVNIRSENRMHLKKFQVTLNHLHFLLIVYHTYIKEFKGYKEQTYRIIEYFFDNFQLNQRFRIQENLEIFVYLRKFIQSEIVLGNGSEVYNLTQKYCRLLERSYKNQSDKLENQLSLQINKSMKIGTKLIQKSKLLENYLLSYPNLWVSTFSLESQNQKEDQFDQIQKTFEFLVNRFEAIFKEAINNWINIGLRQNLPSSLQVNFSYRKVLFQEFKQENLNNCLNCLKLVFHRLWSILEIPKLIIEKPQQMTKQASLNHSKFSALTKNYENKHLNLLLYFSTQKIAQNEEVKFMRLLILMKNFYSYHILRRIRDSDLTIHLEKLFSNNMNQIISSNNEITKRQINRLIGDLVSKLVSGSWTDEEGTLEKYFQKTVIKRDLNKGRRDNRGEWFSQ